MSALFIGPYRQNDGWGCASRDYIKAIHTQISDLSCKPLYYIPKLFTDLDDDILSCENRRLSKVDTIFQTCLVQSFTPNNYAKKNVGITMLETNDITKSVGVKIINSLDEICVPSNQEAKCLKISGVTTPIKVISQPLNIEFYKNRDYKISLHNTVIDNSFKFYTIGEMVHRKNLLGIITAFNLAFQQTDNVSLIIKTNRPAKDVHEEINAWKKRLNLRKQYKQEVVISDRLSDLDLLGLHNYCDCFVSASYGESFCRPAAEALVLGNTPIVTDNTGMTDFINNDNGYIVQSKRIPVTPDRTGMAPGYDTYTADEHWYQPNVYQIAKNMRDIYTLSKKNKNQYQKKKTIGIESIDQFSYENIGKKICV
jgi:glycosyltransferase involved in cell wall biosynthesis